MWSASKPEWQRFYEEYQACLTEVQGGRKAKDGHVITELEEFVWEELPRSLSRRKPPYVTKDELSRITSWKLKRGKWRPRLQSLVDGNDEATVKEVTESAFGLVNDDPGRALDALCVLKGVGPATASAVLAIFSPGIPFMSDELLLAVPALGGELKYTKKAFKTVVAEVKNKAAALGDDWTPQMVERAAFASARVGNLKERNEKEHKKDISPTDEAVSIAEDIVVNPKTKQAKRKKETAKTEGGDQASRPKRYRRQR